LLASFLTLDLKINVLGIGTFSLFPLVLATPAWFIRRWILPNTATASLAAFLYAAQSGTSGRIRCAGQPFLSKTAGLYQLSPNVNQQYKRLRLLSL
jgi:hypothetical protein